MSPEPYTPDTESNPLDGNVVSITAKVAEGERPGGDVPKEHQNRVLRNSISSIEEEDRSENDSDTFHDAPDESATTEKSKSDSMDRTTQSEKCTENGYHHNADQAQLPGTPLDMINHQPTNDIPVSNTKFRDHVIEGADKGKEPAENNTNPTPPVGSWNSGVSPDIPKDHGVPIYRRQDRQSASTVSEWSHQRLAPQNDVSEEQEQEEMWQAMPALGEYDIYDDDGQLVAKGNKNGYEEAYAGIGGAGKGYTRVQLDEDAQSATSMDEDTNYLFKKAQQDDHINDDEQRDALSQLQATKDLLTEGQRIAYVAVTRLTIYNMVKDLQDIKTTKTTNKEIVRAVESMEKWGQQMMVRLYGHMEIDAAEQVMIEQLAEHGVQPADLAPPLMHNSRVSNPMADEVGRQYSKISTEANGEQDKTPEDAEGLPLNEVSSGDEVPEVQAPDEMPQTEKIDLDLRWTVLCDIFLVLISDSVYDARSRLLLERVGAALEVSWLQISRFEKRVMDALEMQEEASRETWNEEGHLENRRKKGLKRKYMVMGLATVGGGIVIGLSAGLLAPVIGAGLAAGFTTIGVTGTAGFLGGVGGAALITSAATAAGGTIAVRASNRRTGHVRTFEYRPLHNNKRLNLILTVSGWMNGKVDDVRLPYSTVDPIMGDIYSLLWEPEMLQSMGDTINILATEALTQTVQQVLGSTILVALMASLQLPIVLTKLSYLIDNPWTVSLDRANAAGLILADSLIDRHLGQRPITLVGFSLGSRLIFSCLRELASRGALGLIQNVYLFGSPIVAKKDEYLRVRSVISGRFVNGYASNDWILGYLFRATSGGIMRVAGLAPVEDVEGLENLDVTNIVNGHMAYRAAMPKLLREVGWEVESDEFTEIEDPDPEDHAKRQRELIQEIDDARKQAEQKPEKKRFGLFKRGKLAEKRGWEMYDKDAVGNPRNTSDSNLGSPGLEANVLFDIDAIRRELESEMIEVRDLGNATLPPMQISTLANGEKKAVPLPMPPSDLSPEELARMKLPPPPSDMGDDLPPYTPRADVGGMSRAASPGHLPDAEPDIDFQPKEIKSTLPPLTLSPPLPQQNILRPLSAANTPPLRPKLTSHTSTPGSVAVPAWDRSPTRSVKEIISPVESMSLEHNAWADGSGKEPEIQMSVE